MQINEALTFKSSAEGGRQSIILALSAKKKSKKICQFRSGVILTRNRKAHARQRDKPLDSASHQIFTKFNTVTSNYSCLGSLHNGSPHNVAEGLFVEAHIPYETSALLSITIGPEYPSESEKEEEN